MVPIIPNRNVEQKESRFSKYFECATLRQWSILNSILIFIVTAVLTTCAILAQIHIQEVVHMLQKDINDLQENEYATETNEIRLRRSEELTSTTAIIINTALWICILNLLLSAVSIYGVYARYLSCIIPWLVVSLLTVVLVILFEFLGYWNGASSIHAYVNRGVLVVTLVSTLILGQMWYTIILYCKRLKGPKPLNTPLVYQAYGGYMHTIAPASRQ